MKLQPLLLSLSLVMIAFNVSATSTTKATSQTSFHFSTQIERSVKKDIMHAEVYSRKTGKTLRELKLAVSQTLNTVLKSVKPYPNIEVTAQGVHHYADYNNHGNVVGWVAEGSIQLKGKAFDDIAQILENLSDDVAIRYIEFSVSAETLASLEDEMTRDIIKQFQHKATLIQQTLNASSYQLSEVHLHTPNGRNHSMPAKASATAFRAATTNEPLPLEAGNATISASASGKVIFE